MDKGEFNRRLVTRLATSPWTIFPVLVGATMLLAAWAVDATSGLLPFAGVTAILTGLGIMGTRLMLGAESTGAEVVEEMKRESTREREKNLDELDRALVADGDSRTEACLRDLRAMGKAFDEAKAPSGSSGANTYTLDIAMGVDRSLTRCITTLEKSLKLWRTADCMATDDAKRPVLERREKLVEEVQASIRQLGELLAGLQALGSSDAPGEDLKRMRAELDERLSVAKRVEERMRSLELQLTPGDGASPDT
jgi:hypothetical protein